MDLWYDNMSFSTNSLRDGSEFLVRGGGTFAGWRGVPVSYKVSEGRYEYFAKVPRGGIPFLSNKKNRSW